MTEQIEINENWHQKFEALKRYKEASGDCCVPYKGHANSLGTWVHGLRRDRDSLTFEQRAKLLELGFDFSTRQERFDLSWRAKYERLKKFKTKFGHTRVPIYPSPENQELIPWSKELGLWVKTQRREKKTFTLAPWRRSELDAIGFEWTLNSMKCSRPHIATLDIARLGVQWFEVYKRLCAYKDTHGDCLVPRGFSEDEGLGNWVNTQR